MGQPVRYPHEHVRQGTAKLLTSFRPATGRVRAKGVTGTPGTVLHPWPQQELAAIVAALPPPNAAPDAAANRAARARWQDGLSVRFALPEELPPSRLLLVLDLAGDESAAFVRWLMARGITPPYTHLSGSWLNRAEPIQRIPASRALAGHQPTRPEQLIEWPEAGARGWNAAPTPFIWGGKRALRRQQARERRYRLGGSGALTPHPIPQHEMNSVGDVQSK